MDVNIYKTLNELQREVHGKKSSGGNLRRDLLCVESVKLSNVSRTKYGSYRWHAKEIFRSFWNKFDKV